MPLSQQDEFGEAKEMTFAERLIGLNAALAAR